MLIRTSSSKSKKEAGFSLLEYVAGATVIAAIVWVSLSGMGTKLGEFFDRLGDWATARTESIEGGDTGEE